jgi:two-component system chemotaxis response regulator CheY
MFKKEIRILFIDDMVMFRTMVKNALTALAYRNYVEAQDGDEAWQKIQEGLRNKTPFDLIISDWTMPKLKGIDLLKQVRSEPWGKSLPFIMLTGESEKQLIMEAIENRVSQYIIKPFTVDQLKAKMEQAYAKWAAETGLKKTA